MLSRIANRFVELPDALKATITAFVLYVVSVVFANAVVLIPFLAFLEPYTITLASAAAVALIAWFQNAVPDAYGKVAIAAIELVLALVAVFTGASTLAASGQLPALLIP